MNKTINSRWIGIISAALLGAASLTGCGGGGSSSSNTASTTTEGTTAASAAETTASAAAAADTAALTGPITVVSREDGSGTRGAFIELLGIQVKGDDGSKTDMTTKEAVIAPKTDVMLTTVSGDPAAIGYVSLGSLGDTVKAVKVDGIEATTENVKSGEYKVARPFILAHNDSLSDLGKDFLSYILSSEGQKIVADNKYITAGEGEAFTSANPEGKLVIVGSSSVSPVMEKLSEGYKVINPAAQIEIQTSDSTSGINAVKDGTCDLGMSSRELKEEETAVMTPVTIAIDGIAVIVNEENPVDTMSTDAIKAIYVGETENWEEVQ